jgi:U2-associated protein SR140
MPSTKKIAEFPDVEAKLQKPGKQSAFEKQKADAEAKRRREAAETAAVYEDFIKSFAHDDEDDGFHGSRHAPSRFGHGHGPPERPTFGSGTPFGGGTGKRHFGVPAGASLKSGPGSLGPPPPSFAKKRSYEGFQRDLDEGRGRLGFDDRDRESGTLPVARAFEASDDEADAATGDRAAEKATSKPTLRLANLPPGTSPAVIKALIPTNLTVENVKVVPPSGPSGTERKSIAAIVTLSKETPATEIDNAVSGLQNRYLGFGFFLTLHRHLSSAAISSGLTSLTSSTAVSHPFGARKVEEGPLKPAHQPMGHGRAYAPPPSYGPPMGGPLNRSGILHVPVRAPRDIKQLRMIHKVIESVLEHGPEFEALLMSRPDVQRDEKWAWIWDARSEGGIWYRWRLWEIVTGAQSAKGKLEYMPLFEGSHAWKKPERRLAYEYTADVDEFVSDSDYDSSEDDELEEEQARQGDGADQEDTFLNPIEKSKLAHLLGRLPTTLSKIRKGDIARVAAFAITHASRGADEIVDMIVSNLEHPFAYTSANPDYKQAAKEKEGREDSRDTSPAPEDKATSDAPDLSAARLLGLYVISDILSSSSTSGIRHAWRYRQLFESALRGRKTFEMLGLMADKLNWGRMRADKWKRSVGLVLSLWEGWCVFPVETHEAFVNSFENPPVPKKEANGAEAERKAGRWKTVEAVPADGGNGNGFLPVSTKPAVDQEPVDDDVETILYMDEGDEEQLDSVRLQYLADLDDAFSDLDLDGEPDDGSEVGVAGGDVATENLMESPATSPAKQEVKPIGGFQLSASKPAPAPGRKRLRAMDMFADSDSDGGT